jgi:hypothetical protein
MHSLVVRLQCEDCFNLDNRPHSHHAFIQVKAGARSAGEHQYFPCAVPGCLRGPDNPFGNATAGRSPRLASFLMQLTANYHANTYKKHAHLKIPLFPPGQLRGRKKDVLFKHANKQHTVADELDRAHIINS